jgi:hypothetical protein
MANRKTRRMEGGFQSLFGGHLTSINFVEKEKVSYAHPSSRVGGMGYEQREGHRFISVPHSRNRSKNPPHPFFKINLSP